MLCLIKAFTFRSTFNSNISSRYWPTLLHVSYVYCSTQYGLLPLTTTSKTISPNPYTNMRLNTRESLHSELWWIDLFTFAQLGALWFTICKLANFFGRFASPRPSDQRLYIYIHHHTNTKTLYMVYLFITKTTQRKATC